MLKIINAHCHLLNYQFIPQSCFRTRNPTMEWMLRHRGTRPLVRIAALFAPKTRYRRIHELFDLMKMDIHAHAEMLLREMEAADIQLAAPLMMDLGRVAFQENPQIPFTYQVKLLSDISRKYPGVLMPFVAVDPRRARAADMTFRCIEEMGFHGLKMYPPLGYHPDPDSIYNEPQTNDELRKVYEYCEGKQVPITTHCSRGGAFSSDLMRASEVRVEFTRPWSWEGVLKKFPNLYLNLAHFGQDVLDLKQADCWARKIRELIHTYPNVYTDLAYHSVALMPKTSGRYFEVMNQLLDKDTVLRDRTLFATDWSMTRHTWSERDYVTPFRRNLDEGKMRRIGIENPLSFLFPGRKFPDRTARFMRAGGGSVSDLPKWLLAGLKFD